MVKSSSSLMSNNKMSFYDPFPNGLPELHDNIVVKDYDGRKYAVKTARNNYSSNCDYYYYPTNKLIECAFLDTFKRNGRCPVCPKCIKTKASNSDFFVFLDLNTFLELDETGI